MIIIIKFTLDFVLNGSRNGLIIASAINLVVLTQFLDFVLLCRSYFSILNKQIKLFASDHQYHRNIKNIIHVGFTPVNHTYDKHFIAYIGIPSNAEEYYIKIIRETHRFLYSLHGDINSFYSLQLLCSVSSSIISIISVLYCFALFSISGLNLYYQHFWINIINTVFVASYNFIKLLIIVYVCTSTSDEVSSTSGLVHCILNEESIPAGVHNELHLFSNQLMHQKIVFTACGFFNLDFTLISVVIGAVSTYMVILIQFQITS
ncbi:uncharacterized protein LOC142325166 [Lycorma delicatula]|uniref:uncharacterized protein LOC142325166 n=1 Tax=Lycorma delicatula TaxID=130591 RepID=UPI003F5113C2